MFVEKLDFYNSVIKYSIRGGDGKLLEPEKEEKFELTADRINFGSRFIARELAVEIAKTLHG